MSGKHWILSVAAILAVFTTTPTIAIVVVWKSL